MGARIIVVDDDPLVGELSSSLLRDAGHDVQLIDDSFKALEAIKAQPPAVAVLDILMPGLDGLTLLHRLKSDPETEPIRAIIVSGKSFEAEKQRAAQYGAEAFIEKLTHEDVFDAPIVTEVKPLEKFYEAEEYHQEYYRNNPDKPYCQAIINPKVAKLRQKFAPLLKKEG